VNPIRAAVERPYTVAVVVLLAVLFSVLAMRRIPVQLKPTIDTPRIVVTTGYRGASAAEVEEQITQELEEVLQNVEGLIEMVSTSAEGGSSITLEFELGTDTQLAVIDVVNKLSQVPRLPEEADEPEVEIGPAGMGADIVMWISADSNYDPNYVRRLLEENVESQLERVPGVSGLFIAGGSEREIQVQFDPDKLVARGVRLQEFLDAISRGNVNLRGGSVETSTRQFAVRTVGRAIEPDQLESIIVKETAGGSVRLGDVAEVHDTYREMSGFVNISGIPGVAFGVRRQVGANVLQIIEDIEVVLDEVNRDFHNRGLDIYLDPVYRESDYIADALGFVTENLLLGAGLAVFVLLFFLRSPRSVLVVALAIPISLLGVFLVLDALDRTINVICLAGIAFASGMVVDNAIVVLENIFRHLEKGKRPLEAAIDGGREVWGGVLASTLTTVAVFVPILLQEDEASQLFRDMALAIAAGVALSLVVALTVIPVLTSLLYRRAAVVAPKSEGTGLSARLYERFVSRLVGERRLSVPGKLGFVLFVAAIFVASTLLAPSPEYLPTGNRNLVLFFADPIAGTRPEAIRDNFKPFEEFALSQPEVDRMFTVAGGVFNGGGLILKEEHATPAGLADMHQRLYGPAFTLAGFRFVVPIRASIFEDSGKQFEINISGPDIETLELAAQRLQTELGSVPGVESSRSSLVTGQPELIVEADESRAKDLGLTVSEIGTVVETMIAGRRMTTLIDGSREVDVNVVAPPRAVTSPDSLASVRFLSADGQPVTLGSVARIRQDIGPQSIQRLERERNVVMTVSIEPNAPLGAVVDQVEREVFPAVARDLGSRYSLGLGGAADKLRTTLASLTGGFGLSVLIIYLLLVSLFRSWFTPIVILVTVPLALTGGLIGIRAASEFTGGQAAFDVIAMLGFVILAGLVVNNAILIVHQANNFIAEGMPEREALAASARSRLRPILMSVVTTVFGMLPLAVLNGAGAELYRGLGAIIVGGLLVSTFFTLFLVPILLSLGYDLGAWLGRDRAEPGADPSPDAGDLEAAPTG